MADKKKKTLILNTLFMLLGFFIIGLYCFMPNSTKSLEEEIEKYMIHFDSDGGSGIAALEAPSGSVIEQPDAPTKEGYVFVGWMLGDELYDFSKGVQENITLKAGWKAVEPDKVYYTVTFFTDGGSTIANQVVEQGKTAIAPSENPVRDGYTFKGWQLDGVDYNFSSLVNSDITITALWEKDEEEEPEKPEDEEKTYTVRFNANGGTLGSGCGNQTIKSGSKASNSCRVTRNGYTFTGWSPNITRNITADTTFRAQWKQNQTSTPDKPTTPPKAKTYLVSFNANGGRLSGSNCGSNGGKATINEKVNPTTQCTASKAHYTFNYWANGSTRVNSITSNVNLSANYTKKTYKISGVEITDGTTVAGHTISINQEANLVSKIEICYSNNGKSRCQSVSPSKMSTNNPNYFSKMSSCTVTFTDSNEKFTCTK